MGIKRILAAAWLMALPLSFTFAQEPLDSLVIEKIEKLESEGFKEGIYALPLPIASYTSDLGLQLGAYVDLYDYGKNPSLFPLYRHKLHVEGSYYTKGSTFLHAEYDTKYLIPGVRLTTSVSWKNSPLTPFYGFNGSVNEYDSSLDRKDGQAVYCYSRNMLRGLLTLQGNITEHISWMGGISFHHFDTGNLNFKGYDSSNTLFLKYLDSGIIGSDELAGSVAEIKAGISWDTRDFEPSPTRGCWAEWHIWGAPDFFKTGHPYLKSSIHWRHYITPGPDWLTLAYHLAWQGTLAGDPPFYMQHIISTILVRQGSNDGLGGLNTVRGMLSTRLIGNDYAWMNLEARMRIVKWTMIKQHWYLAANPFFDAGWITRPYRLEASAKAFGISEDDLRRTACQMHPSAGVGLKLGLNDNSVYSFELAKAFRKDDGPLCLYVTLDYVF